MASAQKTKEKELKIDFDLSRTLAEKIYAKIGNRGMTEKDKENLIQMAGVPKKADSEKAYKILNSKYGDFKIKKSEVNAIV
ncbi:MAG: hypothetical protein ABIH99_00335 [Candidatus Micrarchaeota archaeon]